MYVALLEKRDDKEWLRFPYYVDQIEPENTLQLYDKEGLTGYVVDTGKTLWIKENPNILQQINFIGPEPLDWLGCPLKDRAGNVFGVFTVQSYDPEKTYTVKDKAFLEFVAKIITLLIQYQAHERELAIHKIAALVDDSINLKELYPKLHNVLKEIIPAAQKNFTIVLADKKNEVFVPEYWVDEKDDYAKVYWPLQRGMCGYIYNFSHSSFIYHDGVTSLPPGVVLDIGTVSAHWVGAPLLVEGKIIGVVYIQSYDQNLVITKEDEHTLNAIAPHIAAAITRLHFMSMFF